MRTEVFRGVLLSVLLVTSLIVPLLLFSLSSNPISASPSPEGWWDNDWLYRKEITIDHTKVDANLDNFPVLISITDSDLASKAMDNGDDIAFVDNDGIKLDHEIEDFDDSTGKLVAWVRIPSLSSSENTVIYMYYGNSEAVNQENAAGVWNSSYVMVQHMKDNTTSSIEDSTSNNNDGVKKGTNEPIEATGKIDGVQDFDGSDDYIEVPDGVIWNLNYITVSAWVYFDDEACGAKGNIIVNRDTAGKWVTFYWFTDGFRMLVDSTHNGYATAKSEPPTRQLVHITGTFDGRYIRLYFNGVEENSHDFGSYETIENGTGKLYIGSLDGSERFHNGTIDEVRISNVARSAEWVSTEYYNQNDPSSFYSIGSEVTSAPVISDENPENGTVGVPVDLSELSFTLTDYQGDLMDYYVTTSPDIGSGSDENKSDGRYTVSVSGLNYNTTYTWNVSVTDGVHWTSENYYFTTTPGMPVISDESPKDGSTGIDLNPLLRATITDYENDLVNWWIKENSTGTWENIDNGTLPTGSGTISATPTTMTEYETTYWWSVNAIDPSGSNIWENKIFSFTTRRPPAPWWNANWPFRKEIKINHTKVDADLTNFPVLIDATDNDLASHAQDDGDDIVFTDNSGTKLNHEIELYDNGDGHLVAWVSADLSSSSDTILYTYYGNSSAANQENPPSVWNSNYVMVQHMKDDTTSSIGDSTSNNNDGTKKGTNEPIESTGKIDSAQDFDGSDDYIDVANFDDFGVGTTIELWLNREGKGDHATIDTLLYMKKGVSSKFYLSVKEDSKLRWKDTIVGEPGEECESASGVISDNEWYYVVLVSDGSGKKGYVNTVEVVSSDNTDTFNNLNPCTVRIGMGDATARFNGLLDEIRISNIARDNNWISTSYNNQNSPSTFYSVGSEESSIIGLGKPVLLYPENDSTIYDNTPTFKWVKGAYADNHNLLIDNDSDFTSPVIENIWLDPDNEEYTLTDELGNNNYWWKVVATQGSPVENENSSDVWTFELLPGWGGYETPSTQVMGTYYCASAGRIARSATDKDVYYVTYMHPDPLHSDPDLHLAWYSRYDRSSMTWAPENVSLYFYHADTPEISSFSGYFGGEYYVGWNDEVYDGTVSLISSPTWEGFQSMDAAEEKVEMTETYPAYSKNTFYAFSRDSARMFYAYHVPSENNRVAYQSWDSDSGWSGRVEIVETDNPNSTVEPTLLPINDNHQFLYYRPRPGSDLYYIETNDGGINWGSPQDSGIDIPVTGWHTFVRYGDNFYLVATDMSNKVVAYHSTDGKTWGNKQTVYDKTCYKPSASLIDRDSILWTAADMDKFDSWGAGTGYQMAGGLDVPLMSANPKKPDTPSPADSETLATTSTTLGVKAHGNQTMDVAFYLDNSFVGVDHLVSDGQTASITVSGLTLGENYEWYAVAKGATYSYWGEPDSFPGDENRSDTWSFSIETPEEPVISDESPENGLADVPISLSELSFTLTDYQGDPIDYNVTTSPDIGSGSGENKSNGRYTVSVSDLNYNTTYTWNVTATDDNHWTSENYCFTTKSNPIHKVRAYGWVWSPHQHPRSHCFNNTVYIVFSGDITTPSYDPYITAYYEDTDTWERPRKIDVNPNRFDFHTTPTLTIDDEGYIYVFYGAHGHPVLLKRSTNPEDITSWTTCADGPPAVTYPAPFAIDNTIYVVHRNTSTEIHLKKYDPTSDTWYDDNLLVKISGAGGKVVIPEGAYLDENNRLHVIWIYRGGRSDDPTGNDGTTGDTREGVYYVYSDFPFTTWKNAAGTTLTLPVSESDSNTYCRVNERVENINPDHTFGQGIGVDSDGNPCVTFLHWIEHENVHGRAPSTSPMPDNFTYYFARWSGDNWDIYPITTDYQDNDTGARNLTDRKRLFMSEVTSPRHVCRETFEVALTKDYEIQIWRSTDGGENWFKVEDVTSESEYTNFRPELVTNYNKMTYIWGYGNQSDTVANERIYGYLRIPEEPVISDESPPNRSENIPLSLSTLSFKLTDLQGDNIDYSVETSPDIGSGSDNGVPSGTYSVGVSGLAFNTTYTWTVYATDGIHSTEKMFSFSTIPGMPVISDESPEDGSVNIDLNPLLGATITDRENDLVKWWIKENSTGTWQTVDNGTLPTGSGTISATPTTMTGYGTTYWWSVNAIDPYGSNIWENEIFSFTTTPGTPIISDESPEDGSVGIDLNPLLGATITDRENDLVKWWIKENSTGTWQTVDNGTLPTGSGTISATPTTMTGYETTYWWRVEAVDPYGSNSWENKIFSFETKRPPASWWNNDWAFRKMITIDHRKVDGDLTSFPVLIDVTDNDLVSHAQDDGDDIVFTDYAGDKLNHEIELYDNSTGHLVAWVSADPSSSSDTVLYMYCGNFGASNQENVGGVWDVSYKMVQHMNDNTTSSIVDSTLNNNDGIKGVPNEPVETTGRIGCAQDFDGSNDNIDIPYSASLLMDSGNFTVGAWIKTSDKYLNGQIAGTYPSEESVNGFYFLAMETGGYVRAFARDESKDGATCSSTTMVADGAYHYTVAVRRGDTVYIYVDGVVESSDTNSAVGNTNNSESNAIGTHTSLPPFNGTIDEVRISNVARSAKWISTEYNNQNDPSGFYSIGSEETIPEEPFISDESPEDGATGVDLNPTLQADISDYQENSVDWWIKENSTGTWVTIDNGTLPTGSGTISASPTTMNEYETTYWWSVTATDGVHWTSENYCFTTKIAPGPWWNFNWQYRKMIIIDHTKVDENLTNFPVLIETIDNDLALRAQADGDDIAFASYSGTKLNHEIELYDNSTGHLVAWVSTDLSSSSDTALYMYYGNSSASNQENPPGVWSPNYVMVQHMNDNTTSSIEDSTSNNNDGTKKGPNEPAEATGKIVRAQDFDGSDDNIDVSNFDDFGVGTTIELWLNRAGDGDHATIDMLLDLSNSDRFLLSVKEDSKLRWKDTIAGEPGEECESDSGVISDNEWYYVVLVSDGSGKKGYVDTVEVVSSSNTDTFNNLNPCTVRMGESAAGAAHFNGLLDEIRISDVARTGDWINTSYNTMSSPSTFLSFGNEEPVEYPEEPFVSDENPKDGATGVDLNPTLQADITDYQENSVDWWIKENSTGSWVTIDNGTLPTGSGTISASPTTMNEYETTYWWSVTATDGTHWTSENYYFRTKSNIVYSESVRAYDWVWCPHFHPRSYRFNNTVYIVFGGDISTPSYSPYMTAYHEDTDTWEIPSEVGVTNTDFHTSPVLTIDDEGYIYVFYGCHSSTLRLKRSTNPENITSWIARADGPSPVTYPNPVIKDNIIYVIYRGNTTLEISYKKYDTSSDMWYDDTVLVSNSTKWAYPQGAYLDENNRLHIIYFFRTGNSSDPSGNDGCSGDTREGIYYMYSEFPFTTWKNAAGTTLTLPISESDSETYCRVNYVNPDHVMGQGIGLDSDGNPCLTYVHWIEHENVHGMAPSTSPMPDNFTYYFARWNGDNWDIHPITTDYQDNDTGARNLTDRKRLFMSEITSPRHVSGETFEVALTKDYEIQIWRSTDGGENWFKVEDVTSESEYTNFRPELVTNYNKMSYIWAYGNQSDTVGNEYIYGYLKVIPEEPFISDESPENGATDVSISLSKLSFTLTDYQGDLMDYYVTTSPDIGSGSGENKSNGRYTVSVSGLNYNTTYTWNVSVTDGVHWENEVFSFTTQSKIFISNPSPEDGSKRVSLNPTLSIDVDHLDDHPIDIVFETDASGTWKEIKTYTEVYDGTYTATTTNMNERSTTYNWRVTATDADNENIKTSKTYSFTIVNYKGNKEKIVGTAHCWKFGYIRPASEKGQFYAIWSGDGTLGYARYDIDSGWVEENEPIFDSGHISHCSWGYWDGSYQLIEDGYNGIWVADGETWDYFQTIDFDEETIRIGYNNWSEGVPSTYCFDDNHAWIMVGDSDESKENWYIKYYEWKKDSGWGDDHGVPIWKTVGSELRATPALLRFNRETWYLYYVAGARTGSADVRYVKTTDGGETWENEQVCTGVSTHHQYSRLSLTRYGNNFYMFLVAPNGDAVAYHSTNMENWDNKITVKSSADVGTNFVLHHGTMLHQSALISAAPQINPYLGPVWGIITVIPEMIANPGKPSDPYPADKENFPLGTTTENLQVTVHGDQVYDVAFYWENGEFIGEDKLLEENDKASVQVSGLSDGKTYKWYAIARGATYDYTGAEPLSTSDENRTDTYSFTVSGPPEPVVSDESPENGSVGVGLNPTLQADIIDYQENAVDWWIKENSTGTWVTVDNGTLPTGSGTISAMPTTMTSYETTYWWSVTATDGIHWTSENYCFTTKVAPTHGPWWDVDWQYRKMITIDHTKVDDNLTDFPVLIDITDNDLASHARFDGADIAFADYNGNRLNHEIEFYNGNMGELVAWVNVPELSSTEDTKIYLYYGNSEAENLENPSGVWDSNYMMVQHLPHNWIPYENNPFWISLWHSVFKVGDTYHAYYDGAAINHATSPDGKNWTDDTANNPVLTRSDNGWDSTYIGVPWTWYENGTWYMLYYGPGNKTGLATSPDGINWTKYPNNDSPTPVIEDAEPWAVMKVDNTYYEYYVVNNYMGNRVVCLATSTDLINWTKDPRNPIFSVGVSEPDANGQYNSDAFKYGSYYYILIPHYTSGSDYAQIELYRDTSPTFYPESREYLGAVKPVAHSGWDSHDQDTPAVLTDDVYRNSFDASGGELWVYYNGEAGPRRQGLLICPSIPQALKGVMRDSTSYGNHGAGDGVGGPVPEFCLIGGGYNFDGSDEYMFVSDSSSLDIDNEMTIDVWAKLDTELSAQPNSYPGIISKRDDSSETGYGIWFDTADNELIAYIGSGTAHTVSADVGGYDWTDWHHITVTYDGTMNVYVDNVLENSELIGEGIGTNDEDLWIGDLVDNTGNVIDGSIDEVRISDVARSAEWITTSYNNQINPSAFYDVRGEETPGAPIISDEDPANGAENIPVTLSQLSFKLTDLQGDNMDYTVETSPDIGSGSDNDVPDGTYSIGVSGLVFNTTYTWTVYVTDGSHWTEKTFSFTTAPGWPIISDESPKDGSTGVDLNPLLQATITDYENDLVNWWIKENSTGSWQTIDNGTLPTGSGTISVSPTTMTEYETTYWWSVNAIDPYGSNTWENKIFSFTTKSPPALWWDNNWWYRKTITIDHTKVDANLTDFPVLIDITDNDLASHAQADGDDIVFTDNPGIKLDHEIELYDNGHLVAWVRADLSSIENTILYMYYGNAGAPNQENAEGVWDDNFMMVQHLEENSGTHYDSTSYSNDGSPNGGINQDATGKIDGADEFDGSNDYINVSDDPSLDHASGEGFTYMVWIKSEYLSGYKAIITHRDPGSDAVIGLWTSGTDLYAEVKNDGRTSTATGTAGVTLSLNTWYYVGLTRSSGGSANVWLSGSSYSIGTCTGDITPSEDLYIGMHSTGADQYFDGFIDEVRVSNIERGSGWILTSYNNQTNPSAFYSVGSEEIGVVPEEPVILDESPVNGSVNVELNPTLQADIIDYQEDAVDWWIKENSTGTWQTVDNGTLPTGSGTISATPTTMTEYETTYWWSITATDGVHWASENYCFTTKTTPGPWWDTGWQYRKMITIDHTRVDDNPTDFPVLIDITDNDLASHARFDGADIAFADYDGNRLNHEIEFYDGNTGELVAWVNIPELSSTENTKIYLYYGNSEAENLENPSGVWDSNYVMVQHLPHNWIPYSGNPVFSSGTFASVLKVGDTYHMYYCSGGKTSHATSPDGKNWTDDTENNPVLEPTETWEGSNADVPWVWKENDNWYMMYRGGNPPVGSDATGLAISSDGINWVKYENNPVLVGESGKWDAGGAEIWGTIKVNSTYYTYYECWYGGIRRIGVATSTDLVNWTKDPNNPIMGGAGGTYDQGVYCPCVFKYGSYYYMLVPHYTYGTDYAKIELYRDTSPTFYPENREYLGPVKPVSHTGWDSHDQDTPCVLTDDIYKDSFNLTNGELWMYHDGESGPRQIGIRIAPSIPQALKGAMRDSTNNNNHGGSGGIGGPVPQFSIIGGGYNFDGLDEYMFVSDSSSLDIDNEMTLDVWVKLDTELSAQPNSYPGIISKRDDSSETGYGIWFDTADSELIAYIGSGSAHMVSADVSGYDWTDWHHITVTYDGTMNIYVDNNLENSELIGEGIGTNDEDLWIGDLVDNAGNVIDGSIDEVRISDVARSAGCMGTSFNNENSPSTFYSTGSEENQPVITRGVDVSILPSENSGVPGETLTYTVTVSNTGNVSDNYTLENSDNSGWALSLDNDLLTIPAGENRTTILHVTIPDNATICTRDNVIVTATSEADNKVSDNDSCTAHAVLPWMGTATFKLENLYAVSVNKDLWLYTGSKLVVKFYSTDNGYQAESVIHVFTPPENVKEIEYVPHPLGKPVGRVRLVLTTEDTADEISTIASFTVHQDHLGQRVSDIIIIWTSGSQEEQDAWGGEVSDIIINWTSYPGGG